MQFHLSISILYKLITTDKTLSILQVSVWVVVLQG